MNGQEFLSFNGDPSTRRPYTAADDFRIMDAMEIAVEMGIPHSSVFSRLADELNRTQRAVEKRYYTLKPKNSNKGEDVEEEYDDESAGRDSVLNRLKTLVKERDLYKAKYEAAEEKIKDYDRLARELRQIRRVLGE